MPRRLTDAEKRRRSARALSDIGFEHQDVDARVEAALRVAVAAYGAEGDRSFEAGFGACAVAFWDDIVYSFQRRRAAAKGSRNVERRPAPEVLAAAEAYRRRRPGASTRETAAHVARRLGRRPDAVRHLLRKKPGDR